LEDLLGLLNDVARSHQRGPKMKNASKILKHLEDIACFQMTRIFELDNNLNELLWTIIQLCE